MIRNSQGSIPWTSMQVNTVSVLTILDLLAAGGHGGIVSVYGLSGEANVTYSENFSHIM